jgi:hypothetical protein
MPAPTEKTTDGDADALVPPVRADGDAEPHAAGLGPEEHHSVRRALKPESHDLARLHRALPTPGQCLGHVRCELRVREQISVPELARVALRPFLQPLAEPQSLEVEARPDIVQRGEQRSLGLGRSGMGHKSRSSAQTPLNRAEFQLI